MKPLYHKLTAIIILCALGIIIYSNTFWASFQFDGLGSIVKNPHIRDAANLKFIWTYWPTRFLAFLSFAINYHFHQLRVFGYHLINLIIHVSSAILVWRLLLLTLATPVMKKYKPHPNPYHIALLAGLIFLSHPVQTEAVTYIYQRTTSLAGFFYLLSLTLYVQSRLALTNKRCSHGRKIIYAASWIAAIAGMFTKETVATLPLMIILYEFYFFNKDRSKQWKSIIPFLIILPIIPIVLFSTNPPNIKDIYRIVEQPLSGSQYFLTQLRVMATYLKLLFLPLNQNIDYNYPISGYFTAPSTILSSSLLILILIGAVKTFHKYRLVSFGIFWFFICLLPESTFIPLADVIFEHRLYLPVAGYSFFLSGILYSLSKNKQTALITTVLIALTFYYSTLTYARNFVWKDELTLWNDAALKSPGKPRPHNNLAMAYAAMNDYDQAINEYNKAIALNPNYAATYSNRGTAYFKKGDTNRAIADFTKAISLDSGYIEAYNNRGNVYALNGKFDKAIFDYNKVITINPKNYTAFYNMGNAYFDKKDLDKAAANYDKAIKLNPNYTQAYNNRGLVHALRGNYEQAIRDYNKIIKINPSNTNAPSVLNLLKKIDIPLP